MGRNAHNEAGARAAPANSWPRSRQLKRQAVSSITFMGEPWPTNSTGIRAGGAGTSTAGAAAGPGRVWKGFIQAPGNVGSSQQQSGLVCAGCFPFLHPYAHHPFASPGGHPRSEPGAQSSRPCSAAALPCHGRAVPQARTPGPGRQRSADPMALYSPRLMTHCTRASPSSGRSEKPRARHACTRNWPTDVLTSFRPSTHQTGAGCRHAARPLPAPVPGTHRGCQRGARRRSRAR